MPFEKGGYANQYSLYHFQSEVSKNPRDTQGVTSSFGILQSTLRPRYRRVLGRCFFLFTENSI